LLGFIGSVSNITRQKRLVPCWGERLAQANLQRQQAALAAADTVAASEERAGGARKAFGA
jgi:hypothetical protein